MGVLVAKLKPYLAIICLQFGYSGMHIITTMCLKKGMNHFVLAVYRHVAATIVIAPFALVLERPVLDQNLYYVGLKTTSATFASATVNVLPAITFIMATIFRLERVDIRKMHSQAKIIGTIITVGGAMLMTLYKGPVVDFMRRAGRHVAATNSTSNQHWILGTLMLMGSCLGWAGFFILQSFTLREYPAELSLTALICTMGMVEGAAVTLAFEHNMSVWALGWDSRLLASVYSGVVCSGIAYYIQGVVNKQKGPVFVTAFSPLCMIITAILGSLFLSEQLHLGSILGAITIATGLYFVVWGKSKDPADSSLSLIDDEKAGNGKLQIQLPIADIAIKSAVNDRNKNTDHSAFFAVSMANIIPPEA
ncbi:WAT1-related protein [Drosera capensis]